VRSQPQNGSPSKPLCIVLQLDAETVVRTLLRHLVLVGQHLASHVREHQPLGPDLFPVSLDVGIVQMKPHRLTVEIALRDQQIGALCQVVTERLFRLQQR
jgi:hypothetical protein